MKELKRYQQQFNVKSKWVMQYRMKSTHKTVDLRVLLKSFAIVYSKLEVLIIPLGSSNKVVLFMIIYTA